MLKNLLKVCIICYAGCRSIFRGIVHELNFFEKIRLRIFSSVSLQKFIPTQNLGLQSWLTEFAVHSVILVFCWLGVPANAETSLFCLFLYAINAGTPLILGITFFHLICSLAPTAISA